MLQNYFFLNRFILEIQPLLIDSTIEELFSQEKSKLIIMLSKSDQLFALELCVIPGNSYLNLRQNYSRAKKNTMNFFNDLSGKKISSIEIADNDRIVKIGCSNSDIYFAIRGKFTNIFYSDNEHPLEVFKSIDEQNLLELKKEFDHKIFINRYNSIQLQVAEGDNIIEDIRQKYPFIGSELSKEIKARINNTDSDTVLKTINQILKEINNSKPCVFVNESEQEVHIGFENFKSFPFTEEKIFDSIIEAVNFLLSKKHQLIYRYSKLKLIKNHLDKELKKISNKINNLQSLVERGSRDEVYSRLGKLVLANLASVKSRMTSIIVEDIFSNGEKIKIELNPKLSPQKNAEYYFDKSRSEKISFSKNVQLLEKARNDFNHFRIIDDSLNNIESIKDLDALMKKLKIKISDESEAKEDLSLKFKEYLVDNKFRVFVGKDSRNNDFLTTRFAKQNDYWFHARGVSGSHVVLRIDNTKEPVPKNILKKAAALAAYHSKAKTAGVVPVAYTFKKYVVKKKGDPAGTVHLLKEDVLLVKPEIPNGCEYVQAEFM
jgi:predicted ribosome quality control (RQC) complex YloA/Tae2 family protein